MKFYLMVLGIMMVSITGCDNKPNFSELCEVHAEICNEFEADSWCKRERVQVGLANLAHKEKPEDEQKFNMLISYEKYAQCMGHASNLEHIKLKQKKTIRVNNTIKANQRIEALAKETKSSKHPHLLYFHWSRYLDKRALKQFLLLEGTTALENPESQLNLATYYAKTDRQKTLGLLYHALELYRAGDDINIEILKSISTIFADKKEPKQAYIWSKIIHLYIPDDDTVTEKTLKKYIDGFQLDQKFLDKVAELTLDKIQAGEFKAPAF